MSSALNEIVTFDADFRFLVSGADFEDYRIHGVAHDEKDLHLMNTEESELVCLRRTGYNAVSASLGATVSSAESPN